MPAASARTFSVASANRFSKPRGPGSGSRNRSVTMSRAIPRVSPTSREPSDPGSNGGSDGRMNSSCSPVETSLTRTPQTPANDTRNPKTNIAATATPVLTAAYVAIVTSTSPNAKQANRVRVRTAGGPDVWERSEKARTANTAYRAIVGSSRPYRHP